MRRVVRTAVVYWFVLGFVLSACAGRADTPSGSGGDTSSAGTAAAGAAGRANADCGGERCCNPRTGEIISASCSEGTATCPKSDGYLGPGETCTVDCVLGQTEAELNGQACVPGAAPCMFGVPPMDSCVCECDPDSSIWICRCTA